MVTGSTGAEESWIGVGAAVDEDGALDALVVGAAELDGAELDGAELADDTEVPADAVPGVGAEQATVKTETDSRAAAAMPWRRFTRTPSGRARR